MNLGGSDSCALLEINENLTYGVYAAIAKEQSIIIFGGGMGTRILELDVHSLAKKWTSARK